MAAALTSISFDDTLDFITTLDGAPRTSIEVGNPHERSVEFSLEIEGYLFSSIDSVVEWIRSMPNQYVDEPDYRKAWRFLTTRAYHFDPLTPSSRQHEPLIYLTQSDSAIAMTLPQCFPTCGAGLATKAGFGVWMAMSSRRSRLTGHWRMLDPDFGVYYLNREGEIASVAQLKADPTLITDPVAFQHEHSFPGYSARLAEIYAASRPVEPDPIEADKRHEVVLDLPPGASFTFPVKVDFSLTSMYLTPIPIIGAGRLELPAGTTGEISLPFAVIGVKGRGKISIEGHVYEADTKQLAWRLRGNTDLRIAPGDLVTKVAVIESQSTLEVLVALNPFVTHGALGARTRVLQRNGYPRLAISKTDGPFSEEQSAASNVLTKTASKPLGSPVRTYFHLSGDEKWWLAPLTGTPTSSASAYSAAASTP